MVTWQSGISWSWHEPVHPESGNVPVLLAFVAGLRSNESVADSVEPIVLADESVVQSDESELQSH